MDMDKYFSGEVLYGDDFSKEQISQWYEDEKEGYADLVAGYKKEYHYGYRHLDELYGYKYLPKRRYGNVLGIGSAYGDEFRPIATQIDHLYILEPSDHLVTDHIDGMNPVYKKPNIDGTIDFPDGFFDLIVCFATLHHIPNVTHVMNEFYRCLRPGGFLLLKEPINSMGDWREARSGLTKRERGIPYGYFKRMIADLGFKVIRESPHFTMTSFLVRKTGKLLQKSIYEYKAYLLIDKYLSRLFRWNITYHPVTKLKRIAPSKIFYVLSK
jgi:SAM-dependent methyltransferase